MAEAAQTTTDKATTTAAGTTLDAGKASADAAAGAGKSADVGKDTGKTDAGTGDAAKAYWPSDWQSKLAGEDAAELKQIGRYASPEDIWKKARSLEKRMSSGEFKTVLPKDAKPEEITAWRKDNGLPETPDKYDLNGLKIDKDQKPVVDAFLKVAHGANMSPDQVRAAVEWRNGEIERVQQERTAKDEEQRVSTLDTLNQEWGGTFRRNVNLVNGVLDRFPADVKEALKSARLPDGTAIFNDPNVLRGFVAMALESNPAGVIVPAGGGDPVKGALAEYQEIQKFMGEHRKDYDKDNAKQARMRELIDYLTKNGSIDKNGDVKKAA